MPSTYRSRAIEAHYTLPEDWNTKLYVGFAGYFSSRLYLDKQRCQRLTAQLLDQRWPWPLTSVVFGLRTGFSKYARRLRLSAGHGASRLLEGLINPEHRSAGLDHRADAEVNHAQLRVELGQHLVDPSWPCAAEVNGLIRAYELPEGADLLSWLELMHELMLTLEVGNAVLPVWRSEHMVWSDNTFGGMVLDTPNGDYNLGLRGVFETQRHRANYWRPELGGKYLRHPRWGTYLRREHLDRVGGLRRVRDAVPLARVLELGGAGDLVYLQCTEHPAGALTAEGEGVRHALETVLKPIVAPARPQDQQQTP
jgi:hypothetical protein